MKNTLKLNLGCGEDHLPGFINVDKYGNPDVLHDLESFPWPWSDNSVEHVLLKHVLEHLGQNTDVYLEIIKELYRICLEGATIKIIVPHPRHDDFIDDPTHVRIITPPGLQLFSKSKNHQWVQGQCANTLLALYLNVDFEVISSDFILDPVWEEVLKDKDPDIKVQAMKRYYNVVREIHIILKVHK